MAIWDLSPHSASMVIVGVGVLWLADRRLLPLAGVVAGGWPLRRPPLMGQWPVPCCGPHAQCGPRRPPGSHGTLQPPPPRLRPGNAGNAHTVEIKADGITIESLEADPLETYTTGLKHFREILEDWEAFILGGDDDMDDLDDLPQA